MMHPIISGERFLMDAAALLKTATILLALTAVGGIIMAIIRFSGADRPPSWIAMVHGLIAGSGLTLALYAGLAGTIPSMAWAGIAGLVLAALGGVYMTLAYHDKRLPLPKSIVLGHAGIAVVGFLLLAVTAFR